MKLIASLINCQIITLVLAVISSASCGPTYQSERHAA
jgi:hypothetical protein